LRFWDWIRERSHRLAPSLPPIRTSCPPVFFKRSIGRSMLASEACPASSAMTISKYNSDMGRLPHPETVANVAFAWVIALRFSAIEVSSARANSVSSLFQTLQFLFRASNQCLSRRNTISSTAPLLGAHTRTRRSILQAVMIIETIIVVLPVPVGLIAIRR
jgi:hypothetical protein